MARRTLVICLVVAGAFAAVSAQQGQPRPGPGSGVLTVEGTVNVGNVPSVSAIQAGEWRMAVANTPTVTLSGLSFIRLGSRYQVIWTTGEAEIVTIAALGAGDWVRIAGAEERWVNLGAARSVAVR